jgi:predicted PurR-regulated permease PerM
MARYVSLLIIATLILCLGATFYHVLAPFLMPLFLAAMAAVLAQPILHYFLKRWPNRRTLAASLTTVTILAPVMIPLLAGILIGGYQLMHLAVKLGDNLPDVRSALPDDADQAQAQLRLESDHVTQWALDRIDSTLGDEVTPIDTELLALNESQIANLNQDRAALEKKRDQWVRSEFQKARGQLLKLAGTVAFRTLGVVGRSVGNAFEATVDSTFSLLGTGVTALLALVVFAMGLFYFLADGPDLIAATQALIPVERDHQNELLKSFESSVRGVVMATFLAAIGQGIATSICLKIAGFDYFFVLLALSTFAALIPMAGTPLVWIPAVIWLGIEGNWGTAAFVALFCLIVVGSLDNAIRTWVLKSDTSLHPLLAFVSVLGGVQVMGLWGVFIGPVVACCLHSLIEIFNSELETTELALASNHENSSGSTESEAPATQETETKATTTAGDIPPESKNADPTEAGPAASQGEPPAPAK